MYLLVGGDSEIGAATAGLLRRRGLAVASTTRRASRDGVFLDFDDLSTFEPPAGTEAACIFVAVARLAACAGDPEGSRRINVTQTLALAEKLTARGIYTLWLSTNQVFDGAAARVAPDAPHSPVSAYGRQKAETETALKAMMAAGRPVGILRLAKVVSPGMKLLADWDAALRAGKPVRAFADMTMAPTPTSLVAEAIAAMLQAREPGIAQLTGPRDLSYADTARLIARHAGAPDTLVEVGSAYDAGLPAGATPANTTLDSSGMAQRFGIVVPDAEVVVKEALAGPKTA
jgi:dTDP-4-dehydrorhamnose reductase